jgi:hypothetical protein
VWATTERGKPIPLDARPSSTWGPGLFVIEEGDVARSASPIRDAERTVYVSHFASCPHASRHRSR